METSEREIHIERGKQEQTGSKGKEGEKNSEKKSQI